jgi:N-acetylglucosaminyl-diphospho-decaprenol L-rhamnosyltransferase
MSAGAPAISVVVVSHNSGPALTDCVARVLAQADEAEAELVLVDNGSDPGALDDLPAHPPFAQIRNPGNPGFAVACNQGARAARGALLLFLNPDCLLPPGALQRLRDTFAAAPGIGLLGAQLREADGRPQAAAHRPLPRIATLLRRGHDGRLGIDAESGVAWVEATSGALMLLPRELFEALGGFDEGYRLHCEDLDLCRRVAEAGWRIAVDPGLDVVHLKGGSSRRRPVWVEWQKHRGMTRYLRKFERRGAGRALYPLLWLAVWLRFPWAAARAALAARRAA